MDMDNELKVGISDMKMTIGTGVLATYALGSCIGITFYDPKLKLGALLHVLLPKRQNPEDTNLYKYADTGIEETVRRLSGFGMDRKRTIVKIAGGAAMFAVPDSEFADIGHRNIEMVREELIKRGFVISGEDVGQNYARTMRLDMETGRVTVSTFGKPVISI